MNSAPRAYNVYKSAAVYLPLKLLAAGANFLSLMLLARTLGPIDYGLYSLALAINVQIVLAFGAWLGQSLVFCIASGSDRSAALTTATAIQIALLLVGCTASFLVGSAVMETQTARIVVLLSFLSLLSSFAAATQLAQRKIVFQGLLLSSIPIIQLAILLTLHIAAGSVSLSQAILALAGGHLGTLLIYVLLGWAGKRSRSTGTSQRCWSDMGGLAKRLFKYGAGIGLWFFFWQLLLTGDRFLFRLFRLEEDLGSYSAVRDLATGIAGLVSAPLLNASHPILLQWLAGSTEKRMALTLIRQNVFILIQVFAPVVAVSYLVGPELSALVFGPQYSMSASAIGLIAAGAAFSTIALYSHKGLESKGRSLLMAVLTVGIAGLAAGANFVLLPVVGVPAAAFVFAAAMLAYLIVMAAVGGVLTAFYLAPMVVAASALLCGIVAYMANACAQLFAYAPWPSVVTYAITFLLAYYVIIFGGMACGAKLGFIKFARPI